MARIARVVVPGIPHNVTQRGNRRQQVFFSDDYYKLYLELMAEWCKYLKNELFLETIEKEIKMPETLKRPRSFLCLAALLLTILPIFLLTSGCCSRKEPDFSKGTLTPGVRAAADFSEGMAMVLQDQSYSYAFIGPSGSIVLKTPFFFVDSFSEGRAAVFRNNKWGYIDNTGSLTVDAQFNDAGAFSEGFAAVKINGRYGYIDTSGKMLIPEQFSKAFPFSQDRAKVLVKGKYGFIDRHGKVIVEPQYTRAESFSEDLAVVGNASQCGYIDRLGSITISLRFDDAKPFSEGLAPIKTGNKWRYINKLGVVVGSEAFDLAEPFSEGLGLVGVMRTNFSDSKFGGYSGTKMAYGFVDKTGAYAIQPKFLHAEPFSFGRSLIQVPAGDFFGECENSCFIDKQENFCSEQFRNARSFRDGLAFVSNADSSGFINPAGEVVIRFSGDSNNFSPSRPVPKLKYGFIDVNGKIAIQPAYSKARFFSEGLAFVEGRSTSFINKTGEAVATLSYEWRTQDFSDGLVAVNIYYDEYHADLFGYMDSGGEFTINPRFYYAKPFSNGLAAVKTSRHDGKNNWGYIDKGGKEVIPPQYFGAGPFFGGLALVQMLKPTGSGNREIHYYFIDASGSIRIDLSRSGLQLISPVGPPSLDPQFGPNANYDAYYSFIYPLIPARKNGAQAGFIDTSGKFVIQPHFEDVKPFSEGLAAVKLNRQWGYVDLKGALVIKPEYDAANDCKEGRCLVKKNGKYGYIDSSGLVVIPIQFFQEANDFSCGRALVKIYEQYGYIDASGTFAVEPQFESAESFREGLAIVGFEQ